MSKPKTNKKPQPNVKVEATPIVEAPAQEVVEAVVAPAAENGVAPVATTAAAKKAAPVKAKAVTQPAPVIAPVVEPVAEAVAALGSVPTPALAADAEVTPTKGVKAKKPKLIRDSFTFPETDYAVIASLKLRAIAGGCEIKKGEILRAGLVALQVMSDADLLKALSAVERIKTGRPSKK